MSVNGKFDGIARADLLSFASANGIKDAVEVIDQVFNAAVCWPEMARKVGVPEEMIKGIAGNMTLIIKNLF